VHWNVEIMAAQRIGEETVTYVANSYKYCVAYTLIEQQRAAKEKTRSELQLDVPKQPKPSMTGSE
jgi:hypothetical protein